MSTSTMSLPEEFKKGDRVVVKASVTMANDNIQPFLGRHGVVTDEERTDGRYVVYTDVHQTEKPAFRPAFLMLEVPWGNEIEVEKFADGKLTAPMAEVVSALWKEYKAGMAGYQDNTMENSTAEISKRLTVLSNMKTEAQKDFPSGGERDIMMDDNHNFTLENLPSWIKARALSSSNAAGGWHVQVQGQFWVLGFSETGSVYLLPNLKRGMKTGYKYMIYEAIGVGKTNKEMMGMDANLLNIGRFPCVQVPLVSFYGNLIATELEVERGDGGNPLVACELDGSNKFAEALQAGKDEGLIISRLSEQDLLPNPNLELLNPPSKEEKEQVVQLFGFVETGGHQNEITTTLSFFHSKKSNAHCTGIMMWGENDDIHEYVCSGEKPTILELLQKVVLFANRSRKLPNEITIDDIESVDRMEYALSGLPISIVHYAPKAYAKRKIKSSWNEQQQEVMFDAFIQAEREGDSISSTAKRIKEEYSHIFNGKTGEQIRGWQPSAEFKRMKQESYGAS